MQIEYELTSHSIRSLLPQAILLGSVKNAKQ